MRTRFSWKRIPGQSIVLAVCVFVVPLVASTALNFEDLPVGTSVTREYLRQGVVFNSAYLDQHPAARSGTRVLRAVPPSSEVFTPIPFPMSFVRPQARVKLFAAASSIPNNGTLKAFDRRGALIAQDGPRLVAADRFTTMFEVAARGRRIRRAVLELEGAAHYAIDDLEFDSTPGEGSTEISETRQPSATDNAAVIGKFPPRWEIGRPPELNSVEPRVSEDEAEERFDVEFAPAVERELPPGGTADLVTRVDVRAGLAGSVRWIGTAAPLPVTLTLNGSRIGEGQPYSLGTDRGGADVVAAAAARGEARLSVSNTSNVRIRVRLNLGTVRDQRN